MIAMESWQFILLVVAVVFVITMIVFVWAAVKISSAADRRFEQMQKTWEAPTWKSTTREVNRK